MNNIVDFSAKLKLKKRTLSSLVREQSFGIDLTHYQIYKLRVGTATWFDADDAIVAIQKTNNDYKILLCPVNKNFLENKWNVFGLIMWIWLRYLKHKRVGNYRASTDEFKFMLQKTSKIDADIEFVRNIPHLPEINPKYSM